MKNSNKTYKIRFEDGEIKTIKPVVVDDLLLPIFENMTGYKYSKEDDLYTYTIVSLKNWLSNYGFRNPDVASIFLAAEGIIASDQARLNGGFVAFTDEEDEIMVVVSDDHDDYVCRISKMVHTEITGKRKTEKRTKSLITSVNFIHEETEETLEEIMEQLSQAIVDEDYMMAAALRDRLKRLDA